MGGIPRASLKWCGELDQKELHDLNAPPRCHCLASVNDQDCLQIDATFECEHVDLQVVSTTRHFLILATQSEQEWIPFFFSTLLVAFQNPHIEFPR